MLKLSNYLIIVGIIILGTLVTSCDEDEIRTINLEPLQELVSCNSINNAYTECTTFNRVEEIVSVLAKKPVDCRKDYDYYLLDEKTLVSRNNCKASFILKIKRD